MRKQFLFLVVLALLALALPGSALAQATTQTWTSSITYYTPSTAGGTLQVDFYEPGGTTYSATAITLAAHKAGSLLVGTVSTVPNGFAGAAVLSSDVAVVATAVEFSSTASGSYGRMLYSGFSTDQAAARFYVPTFLYQRGTTSLVGVQNVETFDISAVIDIYALGATTPTFSKTQTIKAQSSFIFKGSDFTGLAANFTGSVVINATKVGDPATPGRVVASAQETSDTGPQAYAFEGSSQGATTLYMASMLCSNGPSAQTSFYAVQNADTSPAPITIKAFDVNGNPIGNAAGYQTTIQPGSKVSVSPCQPGFDVPANSSGSAVITSTGGKVIAIGKVSSNNGLTTAFVGQAAGNAHVAAPYIRWAADPAADFRAYLAIMNVGGANATNITVNYYDGNGNLAGTHALATGSTPLAPFVKRNSTAPQANALTASNSDFGFHPIGGAVEITSDQPIVLVVRMARNVSLPGGIAILGEDYNGVAIP